MYLFRFKIFFNSDSANLVASFQPFHGTFYSELGLSLSTRPFKNFSNSELIHSSFRNLTADRRHTVTASICKEIGGVRVGCAKDGDDPCHCSIGARAHVHGGAGRCWPAGWPRCGSFENGCGPASAMDKCAREIAGDTSNAVEKMV